MSARFNHWVGFAIGTTAIMLLGLVGCKKGEDAKPDDLKSNPPVVSNEKPDNNKVPIKLASRLKLEPFVKSVTLDPPEGARPTEMTCTGKNAVKIFESIANDLWDQVQFTDKNGKSIKYQAIIATELGDMHLDLYGHVAPNHVRSFVCLARSGYFDGMTFYYSQNAKVEDTITSYIESGSPKGLSDSSSGSIGYWLSRELSETVLHEEGTLGACLDDCSIEDAKADCRFYITAARAPQMDGLFTAFGKVTKGLDVVRIINTREVSQEEGKQNYLKQPVLIRGVTIQTTLENP